MRKKRMLEAYLDDFNLINIYQCELAYGGVSSFFYLEDEDDNQIELVIDEIKDADGYQQYVCSFKKTIVFGKRYECISSHGRNVPLIFANIVKRERFEKMFYYEGKLGCEYHKHHTIFSLWAPTAYDVKIEIINNNEKEVYRLTRQDKGVYQIDLHGNYLNASYQYLISVNGLVNESLDPYGVASSPNSKKSVVVDTSDLNHNYYPLQELNSYCDAIVYETSVRDVSNEKNFKAFGRSKEYFSLDYFKDLGITHLQLLPVLDFKSVDDLHPSKMYNWGYDNYEWFCLDNSYSSNPKDAKQVLTDFNDLVNRIHAHGLRVNLDVVYNHVFEVSDSCLEKSVPNYFFQVNEEGYLSNATMCGNDVDSKMKMCRRYIVDSTLYLLKTFNIDGLRFDLMGILDIDTINEILHKAQAIKKDFMVYGEGWNMPSYLNEDERAAIINNAKMPGIAFFDDRFRDSVKGNLHDNTLECGYALGNTDLIYKAMNSLLASVGDFGDSKVYEQVTSVIHYAECHDNMTSWDQINLGLDESDEDKTKRQKMLLAFVLLGQGIPFIQSGQEFARSKGGINDSYNAPDEVNELKKEDAIKQKELIEFTKGLIQIRKQYPEFRLSNIDDVYNQIFFDNIDNKVLIYKLIGKNELRVIFNPTKEVYNIECDNETLIFANGICDKALNSVELYGLDVIILKMT